MKSAIAVGVLAASVVIPGAARAEVSALEPMPSDVPAEARIAVEVVLGGAGAVAGYSTGFMIGRSLQGAGYERFAGAAVGSWLGTSIAGIWFGGKGGHWVATLLGALGGSAVSLLLNAVIAPSSEESGLRMAMMVLLPVGGGVIGYEVGQALSFAPWMKRVAPAISITGDGQGAIAGVAGRF